MRLNNEEFTIYNVQFIMYNLFGFMNLVAQLKDGTSITLLTINTTRFIRVSAKILEK